MSDGADAAASPGRDEPLEEDRSAELRPLPSHYHRCFGCGEDHPTGLHLRMSGGGQAVEGEFTVTEHHQGAPGLAHGGVISAAVDEAMGFLLWLLQTPAVTARLEVDFRRPVPIGATLRLRGSVERTRGRKIYARMTGSLDGSVAVHARALYVKVGAEHFRPYLPPDAEQELPTYNP